MMKYKNIIFSLCVGAAALFACTDPDNHYDVKEDGIGTATQTLWEIIQEDPELQQFARVMQATQFDRDLSSGQMLTIWAAPISQAEADEWIARYMADKQAGIKDEDNAAIVRFVKNHVCMYNRTVSSLVKGDTVKMLNGKYKTLSFDALDGNTFLRKNVLATNGVFYKIGQSLPFFSNIYETLQDNDQLSDFLAFLKSYNEYTLNERKSVPGEVINGQVHYLDSVLEMSNIFMRSYSSYITREDSTYIMLAPTNKVWNTLYDRYSQYFLYPPNTTDRDSLQDLATKAAIFCARTFNANPDVNTEMAKEQELLRDSIMCTSYSRYDWENYVYYKPYGENGIFANKQKVECSNGMVYIDDDITTIDPKHTFMPDEIYNAANSSLWIYGGDDEDPAKRNDRNELKQYIANTIGVNVTDSLEINGEKQRMSLYGDRYVLFSGSANNSTTTQFSYSLPYILSNLYYNIYFVFVPAASENDPYLSADKELAVKFRAYLHEMGTNGVLSKGTGAASRITDVETDSRDIVTKAGIIDTLCLLKAHQFNYTTRGGDDVAWIYITSYVSNSENQKTFTRRIRLNGIIMRAFETKEEAEKDYDEYLNARNQK